MWTSRPCIQRGMSLIRGVLVAPAVQVQTCQSSSCMRSRTMAAITSLSPSASQIFFPSSAGFEGPMPTPPLPWPYHIHLSLLQGCQPR